MDGNTSAALEGVRAYQEQSPEIIEQSDEVGHFDYQVESGTFFFSPEIKLVFEKEGYNRLKKTISNRNAEVEIKLEKDLRAFSSIRQEVLDTVREIDSDNFISGGIVGIAGKQPLQFERCAWLRTHATDEELILLIKYPSGAVKISAFEGLYQRGRKEVPQIMLELSEENNRVYYLTGCSGYPIQIAKYCFTEILGYDLPGKPSSPRRRVPGDLSAKVDLSQKQKEAIIQNIETREQRR